jgi:phosphoribosylformimino-5-aminoimidazole carboxamide ribotide isomerase
VIPAIDLRDGRVVRLRQGDFDREQVFDDDPARIAQGFVDGGAAWIHVVDLDGARDGARPQAAVIAAIAGRVGDRVNLQVAGGLRTEEAVADALGSGAARVVIGTAALEQPELPGRLIDRHGADRIAVALDVRDGLAVGRGWVPGAPGVPWLDAVRRLDDEGIQTVVVTAIDRDGLLGGPDLDLLGAVIAEMSGLGFASGGVSSIDDLLACRDRGAAGAIVGQAIYTGAIDLPAAIGALSLEP